MLLLMGTPIESYPIGPWSNMLRSSSRLWRGKLHPSRNWDKSKGVLMIVSTSCSPREVIHWRGSLTNFSMTRSFMNRIAMCRREKTSRSKARSRHTTHRRPNYGSHKNDRVRSKNSRSHRGLMAHKHMPFWCFLAPRFSWLIRYHGLISGPIYQALIMS